MVRVVRRSVLLRRATTPTGLYATKWASAKAAGILTILSVEYTRLNQTGRSAINILLAGETIRSHDLPLISSTDRSRRH